MNNETEITEEVLTKKSAKKALKPEEVSVAKEDRQANWRSHPRYTARVPGPRRTPRFPATVAVEDDTGAEAPAEAKVSTETVKRKRSPKKSKGKYETPITFGSIDG